MAENYPLFSYLISVFVGVGLAAAAGFRVFLPMFVVSLSSYMGWAPLGENFQWLSSLTAVICLGVATLVEILAYYIPFVDNLLDSIAVPLATTAGMGIFATQFADLGIPEWILAIIAGGGSAGIISSGFAGLRAASSVKTAGVGNSVVSTTENVGAGAMTLLALLMPIIALIFTIILIIGVFFLIKKLRRKKPKEVF